MDTKPTPQGPNMMNMNMGMGGVGTPSGAEGAAGGPSGGSVQNSQERRLLNVYIYDYFLKHDMLDCAKAMLKTQSDVAVQDRQQDRTKHEGHMNGVDDPMDTGDDSRNENYEDTKSVRDLPAANVPTKSGQTTGGGFLLEWWYCFMDIYFARSGSGGGGSMASRSLIQQVIWVSEVSGIGADGCLATDTASSDRADDGGRTRPAAGCSPSPVSGPHDGDARERFNGPRQPGSKGAANTTRDASGHGWKVRDGLGIRASGVP